MQASIQKHFSNKKQQQFFRIKKGYRILLCKCVAETSFNLTQKGETIYESGKVTLV